MPLLADCGMCDVPKVRDRQFASGHTRLGSAASVTAVMLLEGPAAGAATLAAATRLSEPASGEVLPREEAVRLPVPSALSLLESPKSMVSCA